MDLSVVVPAYNVESYIGRCLDSLCDQDLGPEAYQIIVIDDGSTDDTLRIARDHAAADPRITVHSQSNQGVSAARNAGLDRASGRYVYFVDADDHVASGSLRPVITAMREHSLDVASVGWQRVQAHAVTIDRPSADHEASAVLVISGIEFFTDHLDYPTSVWSSLFERRFLDRSGVRFEIGRLYEDQLFMAEALATAERVAGLPHDVYRYTVWPGSLSRATDPRHILRLCSDFEHVAAGLRELGARTVASGAATPAFLERLRIMQEGYVFLLLVRLIRSRVPLRPVLPETIARLEANGFYPLTKFPTADRDHRGWRYRMVSAVLSRRWLLYPAAYAYRVAAIVPRLLSR